METADVIPTYERLRRAGAAGVPALFAAAAKTVLAECPFERAALGAVTDGYLRSPAVATPDDARLQELLAADVPLGPLGAPAPSDESHDASVAPYATWTLPAPVATALRLRHHVVAAVAPAGSLVALIVVDRGRGPVREADHDAVRDVAALVAVAVEQTVLRERADALAREVQRFGTAAQAIAGGLAGLPVALPSDHGLGATLPRPAVAEPDGAVLARLSPSERRVAALLVEGRTNAEIAAALSLSTETVKTHLARIRRKLGAANRIAAVALLLGEAPEVAR